jgi:hypothetical protein
MQHHCLSCRFCLFLPAGTGAGGPLGVAALGTHASLGSCIAVATITQHHCLSCRFRLFLPAGTGAGGPLGVAALGTHASLGTCMAVATSGIPPKHVLWRTNVGSPHFGLSRALDGSKVEDEEERPPEVGALSDSLMQPPPQQKGAYSTSQYGTRL